MQAGALSMLLGAAVMLVEDDSGDMLMYAMLVISLFLAVGSVVLGFFNFAGTAAAHASAAKLFDSLQKELDAVASKRDPEARGCVPVFDVSPAHAGRVGLRRLLGHILLLDPAGHLLL